MPLFRTDQIEIGDVIISDMSIHKIDKSIDPISLLGQLQTMSIYEDLQHPVLLADFNLYDTYNILKKFPITGEEHISVEFQTPGISNTYNANLFIYAVTNININPENQLQTYTLKCASEELFYNSTTIVEKGYNTTIDQIIKDIMLTYLKTTKQLNFDTTKGTQHIIIPRYTPFNAIELLQKRAAATSADSSSFLFFENKNGFNLTTVEDLIMKGAGLVSSMNRTYYKNEALRVSLQSSNAHYNIFDYKVAQQFNVIENLKMGAYRGQMESFDIATKSFSNVNYDATQFGSFASLDSGQSGVSTTGPIFVNIGQKVVQISGSSGTIKTVPANQIRSIPSSNFSKYANQPGVRLFNVRNSSEPLTHIEEFIPAKMGFLGPTFTSSYDLYINGDTSLSVGDVINVQLLHPDKLRDVQSSSPDLLTNGNYLITKMRHNILVSALKPKYTAVLTVVKDTYN